MNYKKESMIRRMRELKGAGYTNNDIDRMLGVGKGTTKLYLGSHSSKHGMTNLCELRRGGMSYSDIQSKYGMERHSVVTHLSGMRSFGRK